MALRPGEEGSLPVEVLAPYPVRVAVEAPGLALYLAPNPAEGPACLRVRAPLGTPPGNYRVLLRAGEAQSEVQVRVGEMAARVVLEACPASGACRTLPLPLPAAGGPSAWRAWSAPKELPWGPSPTASSPSWTGTGTAFWTRGSPGERRRPRPPSGDKGGGAVRGGLGYGEEGLRPGHPLS